MKYSRKTTNYRDITMWHSSTTPAYGHPSLKGGELILAFLLALFLNLPHLFAQSQAYHIGDVITNPDGSKGVVFWLAPDGSGGWMCALNDVSGTYKWSTQSVNISGFPALPAPSTSTHTWQAYATVTADTAGYEHTQRLRAAGNANTYPAAYAVDFAHGWYLPAIGQLLKLYAQQPSIRAALVANGGSEISRTNSYWSSTYAISSAAYYLYNPFGYWERAAKSTAYYVRPVRSFSIQNSNMELSYQWNTGDTTDHITVNPDATTTYQVVVTNEAGCNDTVDFTLYVNSPIPQSITETTCGSYEWHGQSYTESGTFIYAHNNAYGCQQVDTLHLTIISPDTVRFNETVCQGEPYTGHGFNISADSTMIPHTIVGMRHATSLQTSCDSVTILTLTAAAPTSETLNVTILESDLPYILNGTEYDTAGTFVQHLTNANGCDSTLTLNLAVHFKQTTYVDSTVCADELPLTWNGVTFNAAGTRSVDLTASTGADSTVVMTLAVSVTTSATLIVNIVESDLPYILNGTSYDTAGTFVQHLTNANGCDSTLTLNLNVFPTMTSEIITTINTNCAGRDCQYEGPTILINEVMLAPNSYDGSIACEDNSRKGEWIELYNPHKCESADISCFFLGNNAPDADNYGGGYSIPSGTVVPPQGFCIVRGVNAPAVPSSLLVENGGNVVELIVEGRYCVGGGSRLWFPNAGGWFAFYNAEGIPQDAISWNDITNSCLSCNPCIPSVNDCGYDGTLPSYSNIPAQNKNIITSLNPQNYAGLSFRRVPDGGSWVSTPDDPTYGTCNAECVPPALVTCNGTATVNVSGGLPPYSYLWNDSQSQTSQAAVGLCAGDYTVTITDMLGNTLIQQVHINDFVPAVSHPDLTFCMEPSITLSGGYPEGGLYTGTYIAQNQLVPVDGISEYVAIYTYADSNGCTADTSFNISLFYVNNIDTVISACERYDWYGQSYTESGVYTRVHENVHGCEQVDTLHLTINHLDTVRFNETVCQGEPYAGHGFNIPADSTMMPRIIVETHDRASLRTGCDSCTILTLTVTASDTVRFNETVCQGEPYAGHGFNIPADSTATPRVITQTRHATSLRTGCDSCTILTLTVAASDTVRFNETVCQGEPYAGHGFNIPADSTATPRVITQTRHATSLRTGCDSCTILTLTVAASDTVRFNETVCQGEPYSGHGFNIPADSTMTPHVIVETVCTPSLQSGCDSCTLLSLTILPTYIFDFEDEVCEGEAYNGHGFHLNANQTLGSNELSLSQTYTSTLGCDSTVNVLLRVVDTDLEIISLTEDFCESGSVELSAITTLQNFVWNTGELTRNITVNQPGTYVVTASTNHCEVSREFTVVPCAANMYLPNAITPTNADGINDYFCIDPYTQQSLLDFEIIIYDRWGEEVFHSTDKDFKWHGEVNGRINANIMYVYMIKCTIVNDGFYIFRGTVTVL